MPDPNPHVKVMFRPDHVREPLRPRTAAEFAAVVDSMIADDDFDHSYATVYFTTSRGDGILLGLGVFARKRLGAILYQGDAGEFYTRGEQPSGREVFYSDFGNARFFPPDAEIDADLVKAALAALWELDGALPANVRWQQWTDTEH